jgi:hypothetical protein
VTERMAPAGSEEVQLPVDVHSWFPPPGQTVIAIGIAALLRDAANLMAAVARRIANALVGEEFTMQNIVRLTCNLPPGIQVDHEWPDGRWLSIRLAPHRPESHEGRGGSGEQCR